MSGVEFPRRALLVGAGLLCASAGVSLAATDASPPIIDCHIHLYDTMRTHGAAYPNSSPTSKMPAVSNPAAYAAVSRKHGVVGAIMVEASPWIEDNLWALELVEANPLMVGMIGNLQPEKPEFAEYLERYRKHPLFRGIRYATLWGYDLPGQVSNPVFIDGLKRLAAADLVLETNGGLKLLQAALRVSDQVPDLRIVIDHVAAGSPAPADHKTFDAVLRDIARRPNIYGKLSEVVNARASSPDLAAHREKLDQLVETFGEDRIVFGSDWPNTLTSNIALEDVFGLMRAYMASRSSAAQEKFYWRNSLQAYRWIRRSSSQPTA
jgi:L-fuconolactonase